MMEQQARIPGIGQAYTHEYDDVATCAAIANGVQQGWQQPQQFQGHQIQYPDQIEQPRRAQYDTVASCPTSVAPVYLKDNNPPPMHNYDMVPTGPSYGPPVPGYDMVPTGSATGPLLSVPSMHAPSYGKVTGVPGQFLNSSTPPLPLPIHEPSKRGGYLAVLDNLFCCWSKKNGKNKKADNRKPSMNRSFRAPTEIQMPDTNPFIQLNEMDAQRLAAMPPMMHPPPGMPMVHNGVYPGGVPYGMQAPASQQQMGFTADIQLNQSSLFDGIDPYGLRCKMCRGKVEKIKNKWLWIVIWSVSFITCPLLCCLPCIFVNCIYESRCKKCGQGYGGLGFRSSPAKIK